MSATWRAVARKDLEDAVRSRTLWGLVALFVAFLLTSLLSAEQLFPEAVTVTPERALAGVAMLGALFVPGIALVAGYVAVAGERRSGSLRVLLSYPFARSDVVAGKFLGRLLVTGVALLAGYAVASVAVVALYGAPDPWAFAGFAGAGLLLGASMTGLAVGGSAAAATRGRAMALTVGPFVGMVFFWKPAVVGLYYLVEGSVPGVRAEPWYYLLKRLNPLEAFRTVTSAALGESVTAVPNLPLEDAPRSAPPERVDTAARVAGEVPAYLDPWVAVLVLVAWGAVPLALGYRRFDRADLD
jgi:ABC-2 type transport system permease protein